MDRTRVSRRALATAALVSGLVTGLSACGGNPSGSAAATATESAAPAAQPAAAPEPEQAAPVTQPVLASPQPDSALVSCGLAQLRPRVADGDPLLGRAEAFFHQLSVAQLVPPAVHGVYGVNVDALTPGLRHEVLLLLSSLNQCPDVSPQLEQSILEVFDQLAPHSVAQPDTDDAGGSDDAVDTDASDSTGEQIRSDNVDSDDDYADGWGDGYGWWFRPCWTHPSSDHGTWDRWGHDRRDGIWWGWTGSTWERFGTHRPVDAHPHPGKPDGSTHHRPWIPGRRGVPVPPDGTGNWPGSTNQGWNQGHGPQSQGTGPNQGTGPVGPGVGPENPGKWRGGPATGNWNGAGTDPTGSNPTGSNPTGSNPTGDGAGGDHTHQRTHSNDPGATGPTSSGTGNSVGGNTGSTDPSQSNRTFHHPDSVSDGSQNHQSDGWQSHHDNTSPDNTHHDSTTDSTHGSPQHFDQPHFEQPHPNQPHPDQPHPDQPQQHFQPPAPQPPAGSGAPGVHHP